jgi:hypothetical protein
MSDKVYNSGERVKVISGQHSGRVGEFIKNCSVVFADHCRLKLDLKKREKIQKVIMIKKVEIDHE